MKPFRYVADPLCLVAVAAYAANRWWLKSATASPFLRGHFNDLLLIPAALPLLLWVQRWIGLRTHDRNPTWSEVSLHLLVWSVVCEWLGPLWLHQGVADRWDVLAYAIGGVAAACWWNRPQLASIVR